MSNCKTKEYFKKTRLTVYLLLLLIKVLRSSFLNIAIFLIGFCCGFVYLGSAVHHHAYQNKDYESIVKIK